MVVIEQVANVRIVTFPEDYRCFAPPTLSSQSRRCTVWVLIKTYFVKSHITPRITGHKGLRKCSYSFLTRYFTDSDWPHKYITVGIKALRFNSVALHSMCALRNCGKIRYHLVGLLRVSRDSIAPMTSTSQRTRLPVNSGEMTDIAIGSLNWLHHCRCIQSSRHCRF